MRMFFALVLPLALAPAGAHSPDAGIGARVGPARPVWRVCVRERCCCVCRQALWQPAEVQQTRAARLLGRRVGRGGMRSTPPGGRCVPTLDARRPPRRSLCVRALVCREEDRPAASMASDAPVGGFTFDLCKRNAFLEAQMGNGAMVSWARAAQQRGGASAGALLAAACLPGAEAPQW